ncbi:hypothetical protein D8Y23_03750 [Microbacterium enclense]|uniref:Uncharacterized protein n=1 Tax=Microbacterium enclense TaxID=993073 RepID=A0A3S3N0K1_9MICO|nr:hypothetical protein [Microbacterium enclense]RWR21563.1 hypothetical protein D8Y23_03750 [Microbacterium enclense]
MSAVASTPDATGPDAEDREAPAGARQPVVRVRGARRARLLPAPGTSAEPAPADDRTRERPAAPVASGPNDAQLLRDVPPHY